MALETDFNQSPYFDDFKDVAEGKDYHRVLFKPGLAVQTRELTQLQSMMHEQIARFGDNIFKEGTIVDGCAFQYDANVAFVRVRDRDLGGNTISVSVFANSIITGQTSGVRAKVVAVASGTEAAAPDTNVLLVKYLNGGTANSYYANANEYKTFATNETISYLPADGGAGQQANTFPAGSGSTSPFGFGSVYFTGEGIVFGKGYFVNVKPQAIILEKFTSKPSYKVGFKISETLVDSDDDQTLLDNARGSYNYTAPGADRLKLTATLTKKALGTANTDSFNPIFEVDQGLIHTVKVRSVYDVLGDVMAERTYDESGDYEIKKMKIAVKEHYDTGSNFGKWAPSSTAPGPTANTQKLAVGIEPGEAYVHGYHHEHLSTAWTETDKGIDVQQEQLVDVNLSYSNYVDCANVVGYFDPTQHVTVSLRDTASQAMTNPATNGPGTFGLQAAPGAEIGTAQIKFVDHISGTPGHDDGTYRFYLFNIQMANASFSDTRSIHYNDGSVKSVANIKLTNGQAALTEPSFNRSLFQSGLTAVKQFTTAGGAVNAQYRYREKKDISIGTNGEGTVSFSATAAAGGQDQLAYGVASNISDSLKKSIVLVNAGSAVTASLGSGSWNGTDVTVPSTSSLTAGDLLYIGSTQYKIISVDDATGVTVHTSVGTGSGTVSRIYPSGYVFDLSGAGVDGQRIVDIDSATQFSIDLNETISGTMTGKVFFNVDRELAVPADKNVRKNCFVKLDLNTHPQGVSGPWSMGFPDVFNIRKVYVGSNYSNTNRDVTSEFTLLKNSTDTLYKISQIAIRQGSVLSLNSSDKLLVEFDYFHHDRTNGIGFFTADSYPIDPNESTSNTVAISTAEIPRFSSTVSGEIFDLRDTIDFRPRYNPTAAYSTTVGSASENPLTANPSSLLDIDGTFGSRVPVPDLTWESDAQFYLPRIDRVVVGKDGSKRVVRGTSNEQPYPPQQPAEAMSLALLTIPPYPSLSQQNARRFNRLDLAVQTKQIVNKRYRMKDIAAIDQRVSSLEYYSSLNVLEKAASDLQIIDDNGLNRFKNGIFVDSFHGHDSADTTNRAYRIAVDAKSGEIRPKFEQFNIDLELSGSSNVARKGKHKRVTVNGAAAYIEGTSITTTSGGSGTVRAVVLISGNPSTSSAVYRLYCHNTSGTFAVTDTVTGGGGGTISEVVDADTTNALMLNYTHQSYVTQPWASNLVNPVAELQFNWIGELSLTPQADHWKDTTTLPEVNFEVDVASSFENLADALGTQWGEWNTTQTVDTDVTVSRDRNPGRDWRGRRFIVESTSTTTTTETITESIRNGFRLDVQPFTSTESTGPFITDIGTIPFIRSREISFSATGMRPNTRVYPFFEDTLVSSYVTPAGGSRGDNLVTDSNGKINGVFLIPNDDTLKFRVGERTFKLTDISDLIVEAGNQTTTSVATYNASGMTVSQRGISFSTREPTITRIPEQQVITDVNVTSETQTDVRFVDPVAQTFEVGSFEYTDPNATSDDTNLGVGADGVFITGIDLYFERRPSNSGIAVEIREVRNGQITTTRVPFGYKRIEATDVNVSSDSTAVTPFYFEAPVYLRGGREYCFIVKPDGSDPGYRLWTSRLGNQDVRTNAIIDQQPAVGMMFTSANDRTYSPRQNEDIKFTIWRAAFSTGTDATVTLTNQSDEYIRTTNLSGQFTIGESVIGESLITLSGNTGLVAVGDRIKSAAVGGNVGLVRHIVDNTAGAIKLRADIDTNNINASDTVYFTRAGNLSATYTGTVSAVANTLATGTVQYFSSATGDFIIDNSGGSFVANTTIDNGYIRGLTSNNSAQIYSTRDLKYNVVSPKLSIAQYVDTNVSVAIKTTSNTNVVDSSFTTIRPDADFTFHDAERIVAGATKEANTVSGKTLTLRTIMSTNNDRVSPIFDLDRAKSLIMIKNVVNNTANNEFGNYGLANAKYISKKIILADGQDAEDIKVILDAYRPAGTDVQVYARIQNEYDGEDWENKHYTKLVAATTKKRDSSSTDKEDFLEVEYNFPTSRDSTTQYSAFANTNNSSVVEYKSIDNDVRFTGYKYYSIKVVLTSTGSHLVPRVRALRAIALQR